MNIRQKIRFSDVSSAIELTPKAFRNWLQRYELHLISDHKTRGWTDFVLADVAVLALTREMVRWGVNVETANGFALIYLQQTIGPIFEFKNVPPEALLAGLEGRAFCLGYKAGEDEPTLIAKPEANGVTTTNVESALWIAPKLVIEDAFSRIHQAVIKIGGKA